MNIFDVSEKVQSAIRLKEFTRYKTRLYQSVSHDLKTPLNSIIIYCQLLKMQDREEDCSTIFNSIHTNARILLTTIDNIID